MSTKVVKAKRAPRTMKEKKFVKEYINNGGNATQAALAVYDTNSYKSASRIGNENTAKLSFEEIFADAGLTKDALAQNTTRIAFTSKKQNQFTGEVENDDAMQLKAMDFATKLAGWVAPPRAPVDEEGKTVIPIYGLGAE